VEIWRQRRQPAARKQKLSAEGAEKTDV